MVSMNLWQRVADAIRRPKATPALTQGQTDISRADGQRAGLALIQREFAGHPSRGLTPASLYAILEDAERGDIARQHALYMDMEEKDAQIAADLGKRKLALTDLEWQIVAPENASRIEKKAAAQAQEVFGSLDVDDLILDMADGIGHGWVNLELPWDTDGLTRIIHQPIWRPHSWFMIDSETDQNELRLRDGSMRGEELWPLGWMRHIHKAKSGYITRLGLHRVLVWPYLFQNYALSDLAELLDILGIPARLGTYPQGSSETEKATLLRAVTELGRKAAGIIPDGMRIEYLESAKTTSDPYQVMLNWCERSKSKAILGGTLTSGTGGGAASTGTGGGSYALGEVHERGLAALVGSDAKQISGTICRDILFPLAALNFGITTQVRAPRFFIDTGETEDYELLSKSLPTFVSLGAKIPTWWLHEKTGIPEAEEGEEILTSAAPTQPVDTQPTQDQAPQGSSLTARLSEQGAANAALDAQIARLTRQTGPLVDAMLSRIRAELKQAPSLEAFQAKLLAMYPELVSSDLSEILATAFAVADLTGRYDAGRTSHTRG